MLTPKVTPSLPSGAAFPVPWYGTSAAEAVHAAAMAHDDVEVLDTIAGLLRSQPASPSELLQSTMLQSIAWLVEGTGRRVEAPQ